MTKIQGGPSAALERVQTLVRDIVPNAQCELEDDQRIGCTVADQFGNVHAIKFPRDEWVEEIVRHKARFLRSLIRTGRSTAE